MPKKPERIIINCDSITKEEWERFALPYEDYEDALQALMDAHKNNADAVRSPGF